jgi:hypothetical protein
MRDDACLLQVAAENNRVTDLARWELDSSSGHRGLTEIEDCTTAACPTTKHDHADFGTTDGCGRWGGRLQRSVSLG